MARCPLIRKDCPETSKGKRGCAWWIDVPTEEGFESMCVMVAQYRLSCAQIQETRGVHAAVNSQRNESVKSIGQLSGAIVAASSGMLTIPPHQPQLGDSDGI